MHSLTDTMSMSEKPLVDVVKLSLNELIEENFFKDATIEIVVKDGKSDPKEFAREAKAMIEEDGVSVIFGCWTSASRKEVKPIVEQYNHLLVYPVQYEGVEQSNSILYLGSTPNQQIKPAIKWAIDNIGTNFYLIGSDYIFPKTANAYIKEYSKYLGATILNEQYVSLGYKNFHSIVEDMKAKKPSIIFNTLNGDSNRYFFEALYRANIKAKDIPVISFSISKNEINSISKTVPLEFLEGHLASWSYFETINNSKNKIFKQKLSTIKIENPTDPMESAYFGVKIWANAVKEANSFEAGDVKRYLSHQSILAPSGIFYIDPTNYHTYKSSNIAKIDKNGDFQIIWGSSKAIKPEPIPTILTENYWLELIEGFKNSWNGNWSGEIIHESF